MHLCARLDVPLLGRYGQETLERTGAFRVNSDPADRLTHMENLEFRRSKAHL